MCNYSSGPYTTTSEMVDYVKKALLQIPKKCHKLLVSPSGSMFDEREVPADALTGILTLLASSPHNHFSFESRAETITEKNIHLCQKVLNGRLHSVYVGLESSNPFLLKYCINKELDLRDFEQANDILHRHRIRTIANVMIGVPFLNCEEDLVFAVETIRWAFSKGVDECHIFPTHVKTFTPLENLYQAGLYHPTSLWSLVEVLRRLGPVFNGRLRLSWYTSLGAYNIVASPDTCPQCNRQVIELMDAFTEYQDEGAVAALQAIDCSCKTEWADSCRIPGTIPLSERILTGYKVLADNFLEDRWWVCNSKEIISSMDQDLSYLNGDER